MASYGDFCADVESYGRFEQEQGQAGALYPYEDLMDDQGFRLNKCLL